MCMYSAISEGAELGAPTDWHRHHYFTRALGGVGALIVEATGVTPEGRISSHCLSLHDDALIPAFATLADAIHQGGAAAFIQLGHAGRKASRPQGWLDHGPLPIGEGGWETVAPSPIPFAEGEPTPHELTEDEIWQIIEAFVQAARRAVEAGFDGVQLHGAHGYLIHQFLSPASNQRTDAWGGSFDGRTRFVREITRRVRKVCGDKALLIRLSATDWSAENPADGRPGWTLEETVALTSLLVEDGMDMFCMSSGGSYPDAKIPAGPGYQVFGAQAVRAALRDQGSAAPVSVCGLIQTPEQGEQILVTGQADVVEVARGLLSDPMLPQVWRSHLRCDPELPPQYQRSLKRL